MSGAVTGIVVLAAEASAEIVHVGGWFLSNAWIIPAIPAASFFAILFFGKRMPRGGSELGIAAVGASLVLALCTAGQWIGEVNGAHGAAIEPVVNRWTWWVTGGVDFTIGTLVDGLAVALLFVVTAVSLLVHIYSTDYVAGDVRYTHFFAFLSLFTASMLFFVLAENTIQMIVGWELVGVCSFVLIGHWWEEKPNSDAALKAFLTNRVGDVGLIVGVSILFFAAGGTFSILEINTKAIGGEIGHTLLLTSALCLLAAVMSKSGQFFLHTWLPDAMAGPTPVSALIHAATMVTSGVYLLVRFNPLFEQASPLVGEVVAAVGLATAAVAATIAVAANDIKKVLAYSTISQLGFMFVAVGVGAWTAAIFHMVTHAFFKALLFLGAGSVIHGMGGEQDIRRYGGLARAMPQVAATFAVGTLAIVGVPPLAGFWSKDEILAHTWGANKLLWALLLLAAVMTAFYMTRLLILTFGGEPRWPDGTAPHESPLLMRLPLFALAGLATVAGVLNLPFTHDTEFLGQWLEPVFALSHHGPLGYAGGTKWILGGVAILAAAGGIWAAVNTYARRRVPAERVERQLFAEAWGFDEALGDFVGGPGRRMFEGTARFDAGVVDGAVNKVGALVRRTGERLRATQSGLVRRYALGVAAGAVALLAYFFSRVGL